MENLRKYRVSCQLTTGDSQDLGKLSLQMCGVNEEDAVLYAHHQIRDRHPAAQRVEVVSVQEILGLETVLAVQQALTLLSDLDLTSLLQEEGVVPPAFVLFLSSLASYERIRLQELVEAERKARSQI